MKKSLFILPMIAVLFLVIPILLLFSFRYFSRAENIKANIVIDTQKTKGALPDRWRALAQGGEESGTRMIENVIPQISALYPKYIRIDHIYDYYDVIKRKENGDLEFNWSELDKTVCDIYHTGAKPFFVLGYMAPAISRDSSLVSVPTSWEDWALTVQKTIERYSGRSLRLCGQIYGDWLKDIYYEVWNEPDLETFGKWSLYGGEKDYKKLYFFSSLGGSRATDVYNFYLGGPVTTRPYKNWMQTFLRYVSQNNLKLDFISWHHYSKNPDDFSNDIKLINSWLSETDLQKYINTPKIISEWGYDSDPNPISETDIGAAHTIMSIRNFLEENLELGFLFEIKDGPSPRWGILSHEGEKKPRYNALRIFNLLSGDLLKIEGEGTFVRAVATKKEDNTTLILVNYDQNNKNTELVPVTITNIKNGQYNLKIHYLEGGEINFGEISVSNNMFRRDILMPPNMVVAVEMEKNNVRSLLQ